MKFKNENRQVVLTLLPVLAAVLFAYAAADKFLDSVAVLRYTVPAQKRGAVLSLYDYLRETGLRKYFLMMPSSAQRCFLFSSLNCCGCIAFLTAAITLAVKSAKSLARGKNSD